MWKPKYFELIAAGLFLGAGAVACSDAKMENEQAAGKVGKAQAAQAEKVKNLLNVLGYPDTDGKYRIAREQAIKELTAISAQLVETIVAGPGSDAASFSANLLDRVGEPAIDPVRATWLKLDEVQKWQLMRFRGKFDYEESAGFAVVSLESKNQEVRQKAIIYVGKHKEARARRILLRMLNTTFPESHRWLIVTSLSEMGNDDETAQALVALLARDSWAANGVGWVKEGMELLMPPECRHKVIEALAKMEAKQTAAKLLEVLQEKGTGKGYLSGIIMPTLAEWQYVSCVPELKRIMESGEVEEKGFTAACLLQLKDRTGITVLAAALASKDEDQRQGACTVIARYGTTADLPLLALCLDDSSDDVRISACHGLERITGVVIREPGETQIYLSTVKLWKAWWEKNGAKYVEKK